MNLYRIGKYLNGYDRAFHVPPATAGPQRSMQAEAPRLHHGGLPPVLTPLLVAPGRSTGPTTAAS
jgi:hypothetical protein